MVGVRQRVRSSGSGSRVGIKIPSLRSSSLNLGRLSRSNSLKRCSSENLRPALSGGTAEDRSGTHGYRSSFSAENMRQVSAANAARQEALRSPRRRLHASKSASHLQMPARNGSNSSSRTPVPRLNLAAVPGVSLGTAAQHSSQELRALLTPPREARKPRLSRRLFHPVDSKNFSTGTLDAAADDEDARASFHTARGSYESEMLGAEPGTEPNFVGSGGSLGQLAFSSSDEDDASTDESFEVERLYNEHRAAVAADTWRRRSGAPTRGGGTSAVPARGARLPHPAGNRPRLGDKITVTDGGVPGGPSPFSTVSLFQKPFGGRGGSTSDPTRAVADEERPLAPPGTGPSHTRGQKAPADAGGHLGRQPPQDSAFQMHGASVGTLPEPLRQPVRYEGRNLESEFELASDGPAGAVDSIPSRNTPLGGSVHVIAPVVTNPAPANLPPGARGGEGYSERAAGYEPRHRQHYGGNAHADSKAHDAPVRGAGTQLSTAEQVAGVEQRPFARPAEMAAAAARALLPAGPRRSGDPCDDAPRGIAYSDDGTSHLGPPPPPPSPSDSLRPPAWAPPLPYPPYGHHPMHAYSSLYYPYHSPFPPVPPELHPYYRPPPGYPMSPESLRHGDTGVPHAAVMRTRPLSPSLEDELVSLAGTRRMSLGSRVSGEWVRSVVHEAERAATIAERAAAAANEALQRAQQVQEAPPPPPPPAPAKVGPASAMCLQLK